MRREFETEETKSTSWFDVLLLLLLLLRPIFKYTDYSGIKKKKNLRLSLLCYFIIIIKSYSRTVVKRDSICNDNLNAHEKQLRRKEVHHLMQRSRRTKKKDKDKKQIQPGEVNQRVTTL